MFNWLFGKKYNTPLTDDYIIVSVYFNPQNSEYRRKAFDTYYKSIKHLNHKIIECVIGDTSSDLEKYAKKDSSIEIIRSESLLWHKESLINYAVKNLESKYKYVFWIDADVIFENVDWLVQGVASLSTDSKIIQPFSRCYHLEKDQKIKEVNNTNKFWISFCYNWTINSIAKRSENYDLHGHVGFAWGARREVLDAVPLYDKCLVGGADHIIAHAATGQFNFPCITKAFKEEIKEIDEWQRKFYAEVRGSVGSVFGDLYHIWHGDIAKRQYLKRIKDFDSIQKDITEKDCNGLYIANKKQEKYVKDYFDTREVKQTKPDDSFFNSLFWGYLTNNAVVGYFMGGNIVGSVIGSELDTSENETNQHRSVEPQVEVRNDDITPEIPAQEPDPLTNGEVITNEGVFATGDSFGCNVDTNENFS